MCWARPHYRAGHFDQAIQYLEESIRAYIAGGYAGGSDLEPGLRLALAQSRLGHTQAGTRLHGQIPACLKRVEDTKSDGAVSLSTTDWLPLQLLRREAEALILYDPVFPADPFAR